jgi:fibronectin-binding autotransporter adhesin
MEHRLSLFGDGKVNVHGYGLGATGTWYDASGFYLDGQAQFTWYNTKLRSDALGRLSHLSDGNGRAFSLEAGRRIGSGRISFTPQAQLTYSKIHFDGFTDNYGAQVSADKGESLRARFGVAMDSAISSGTKAVGSIYGIANVNYELLDGTRTEVSGTLLSRRDDRLWGELGFGGNYRFGNVALYGEASVNSALKNLGDSYGVKGQVGLRLSF